MLAKTLPKEGGVTSLISCILSNYTIIFAEDFNLKVFSK